MTTAAAQVRVVLALCLSALVGGRIPCTIASNGVLNQSDNTDQPVYIGL